MILQQIVNAISLGGIYALLALGLAMVFSIIGLINFAHGELMTVAGYVLLGCLLAGVPWPAAILGAVLCSIVCACMMELIAFRPMRAASITSLLLTSFAVSVLIRVLLQNGISARPMPVALPAWITGHLSLGPITVGVGPLVSIVVCLSALAGLEMFLKKTTMGTAMRAAAADFDMVRLVGIPANRVVLSAFAISGMLAGIAAVLWVAQRAAVDPLMGFTPVLKAFVATVVGGLGSLSGAVVGGFLLGAIEVAIQATLTDSLATYQDAIVLAGVVAILLFKPQGLVPVKRAGAA